MTDTTDIKELREKYTFALKYLTNRLAECNRLNYCGDELSAFAVFSSAVIDQLEAERQRADQSDARIVELEKGEKYWFEEFKQAEAEIAALKGDQVPVAEMRKSRWSKNWHWFTPEESIPVGTQLFTVPQKPVAKLAGDMPRAPFNYGMYAKGWNDRGLADKLAIEAAGGIVKDGD